MLGRLIGSEVLEGVPASRQQAVGRLGPRLVAIFVGPVLPVALEVAVFT